jgi:pyruvate dehydrogenase E1 component alpha subunit
MRVAHVADRAAAYGIRGQTVDGNDVLAVFEAARAAAADCRSGQGPVLLELLTYRRTGHSRRDPCHYQSQEERDEWFARDPIDRFARLLVERGLVDRSGLEQIRARVQSQCQSAVVVARDQPLPTLEDLTTDVFA